MTQPEDLIVGKSVEEIEAETGNRVNSSVGGEGRRDDAGTVLVPAASGEFGTGQAGAGTVVGTGALGGLPGIIGTELGDDGSGRPGKGHHDHADRDLDSSEE